MRPAVPEPTEPPLPGAASRLKAGNSAPWLLAGYAGLAGFFALEILVREPGTAASLRAPEADRGTTNEIVRAFAIGAALPVALAATTRWRFPAWTAPIGLAAESAGLILRLWSMRTLGASYTRTLRAGEGQAVVDVGPYRAIRHPGYLGTLLTWVGFSLTSRQPVAAALVASMFGRVYRRRIAAEERLLGLELPGYQAYARRTRRLIPVVW